MKAIRKTVYSELDEKIFLDKIKNAEELLRKCALCPRHCGVARYRGERGYCNATQEAEVAHWQLHFGEEPPLSGSGGAGAIFFQHCNMKCVYCQNYQISQEFGPEEVLSSEALSEIMLKLQQNGAENIDLVSPAHFMPRIIKAIYLAREKGLSIPMVYNTNGYESSDALKLLDGIIDIYLPDIKYSDEKSAERYSDAGDYWARAKKAIAQMHEQVGDLEVDARGVAKRGLLVRHLVLPNAIAGSLQALDFLRDTAGLNAGLSLMSQYAPCYLANNFNEINRKLTASEYAEIVAYVEKLGFTQVWIQELESSEVYFPDFDSREVFGNSTNNG